MTKKQKYRALALIDRDGTLIEEREYLSDPAGAHLIPRAAEALSMLASERIAVVITTNQSGVGRGLYTEEQMHAVNNRVVELLREQGAEVLGVYYSLGHPDSPTAAGKADLHMRKPATGMADKAKKDHGLHDLPVFSIGDKYSDVEFGRNAGGEGILVRTGYGNETLKKMEALGDSCPVSPDVYDAARLLLNHLAIWETEEDEQLSKKLRTPAEVGDIAKSLKATGKKVVFANGCFDILHGGHISFIENAREAGDVLVLGVNSNASIRRLKGAGRPVFDEAARLQMLAALQAVDYLTVFHEDSADNALREIHPTIHAKGTDYSSDNVPELKTSRELGIKTVIAGAPKENSTRDIIEVVLERARKGTL